MLQATKANFSEINQEGLIMNAAVIPMAHWIYNLADYKQIFSITDEDLIKKILVYPSGISSVNAELYALGCSLHSGDPFYHLSPKAMQVQADHILQRNIAHLPNQLALTPLISRWEKSKELFLADYALGKEQGRYQKIDFPKVSAQGQPFDLLLCADLLFDGIWPAYSAEEIINELCGLAQEVRIFPLPQETEQISTVLGPILLAFQQMNYGVEVRAVTYPWRPLNNAMLRLWARECTVNN